MDVERNLPRTWETEVTLILHRIRTIVRAIEAGQLTRAEQWILAGELRALRHQADLIKEPAAPRLVPEGAAEPLPPAPPWVKISDRDIHRGVRAWNRALSEAAGLLDAEPMD